MDEGNIDSFKKLLFDNALGNIGNIYTHFISFWVTYYFFVESSPHADKQRRWRAKKKDQLHRTQLSLRRLLVEQIVNNLF